MGGQRVSACVGGSQRGMGGMESVCESTDRRDLNARPRTAMEPSLRTILSFASHVVATATCWWWTGAVGRRGTPVFSTGAAHRTGVLRMAWFLEHNAWPPRNMQVQRTCGNSLCVCPDHLVVSFVACEDRERG